MQKDETLSVSGILELGGLRPYKKDPGNKPCNLVNIGQPCIDVIPVTRILHESGIFNWHI